MSADALVAAFVGAIDSKDAAQLGALFAEGALFVNILGIHLIGLVGTQLFWGGNARTPIGG